MVRVPLDIRDLEAHRDLATGSWVLRSPERTLRVRPWCWGERRRMVEACTVDGRLDRGAFVDALVDSLIEPAPPDSLRPLYASLALSLLEVEQAPAEPLSRVELRLARALGWGPRELDLQPAAEVDRLLGALAREASGTVPEQDGWSRILVEPEVTAAGTPGAGEPAHG